MIIVKDKDPLFYRVREAAESMVNYLESATGKKYKILEARKKYSSVSGFVIKEIEEFEEKINYKNFSEFVNYHIVFQRAVAKMSWNAAIDLAVKIAYDSDKNTHPSDLAEKLNELKEN